MIQLRKLNNRTVRDIIKLEVEDSQKDFVDKAIKVHGTYYDYSKVRYVNSTTKVEIICPIHGSF